MIYFDNAATTYPKPPCVCDEINRCIKKYCGNPGRSSHILSVKSAEKIYYTRQLLGEIFGAEPENVVFTLNTTYALNIAIKGYLRYSTHVLISDIEHNSVLRPIHELSSQKKCTYDIFSTNGNDEEILENIKHKLKANTTMLVCTHMSNICSRRLPIEKIGSLCKDKGIYFIVDGAQSAGLYDINVSSMNIDALCIPGHKSLYGPQGIGAIVFNNDNVGRSIFEGGTGINSKELKMPDILPERYEPGTLSTPLISGLCGALKWLKAIEPNKIRLYEEDLYLYLLNLIKNDERFIVYKGSEFLGNTLLINAFGLTSTALSRELDKRGICTRGGLHCTPLAHKALNTPPDGAVRISFSVYNTKAEINILYEALCEITKQVG